MKNQRILWRGAFWLLSLVVIFGLGCGLGWAKPTVSGLLVNYNPGAGKLQIKRADGVIKHVVMRPNAIYALNGVQGSPHYFKVGMQVAVRICGSITDDPLQGDLLIDAFSSGAIVQRRASSYGNTPVGGFASVGGASGVASMPASMQAPVVAGIGLGGIANNPSGFNGANMGTNPSFNQGGGLAVSTIAGSNPPASSPSSASLMGGGDSGSANSGYNPYDNRAVMGGMNPNSSGTNAGMAAMMSGDEPKDEEQQNGMYTAPQASSGPLGLQIAQIQGGILSIDTRNRVLAVVPHGSMQPVQVKVPQGVNITSNVTGQAMPFESLRTGQGVNVSGMSNAAGIVEARQMVVIE